MSVLAAMVGCGPVVVACAGMIDRMKIERTYDMALVRQIVMHPAIWPHVHEDNVGDDWQPVAMDEFIWMLISDPDPIGVFLVHQRNAECYEMHTCLLPESWGAKAAAAAQMLLRWAFTDLQCRKMITAVPEYNRAALRFAKAGGMQQEGINRASYLHAGQMIDQIMLGITKEEWLCQQQYQSQS